MRGNKYSLLLLLSLMVIPIGFAAAATSQGLSWGVAVDDEFRFTLVSESNIEGYPTINEIVVVTITSTPTIPDPVTSTNPPTLSYDMEFENGTATYLSLMASLAYPVGNWAVFTEFINEGIALMEESTFYSDTSGSIIDSLSIWGYTFGFTMSGAKLSITVHYSKSDGVQNYLTMRTEDTTTDDYMQYTMTREGYLGGTLGFDPMIAIIGVIGVVAVIIIIVIIKKR